MVSVTFHAWVALCLAATTESATGTHLGASSRIDPITEKVKQILNNSCGYSTLLMWSWHAPQWYCIRRKAYNLIPLLQYLQTSILCMARLNIRTHLISKRAAVTLIWPEQLYILPCTCYGQCKAIWCAWQTSQQYDAVCGCCGISALDYHDLWLFWVLFSDVVLRRCLYSQLSYPCLQHRLCHNLMAYTLYQVSSTDGMLKQRRESEFSRILSSCFATRKSRSSAYVSGRLFHAG